MFVLEIVTWELSAYSGGGLLKPLSRCCGQRQILKDTYDLSFGRWGHASGQVRKRGQGQKPRQADLISARDPESAREKRMVMCGWMGMGGFGDDGGAAGVGRE